MAPAPRTCRIPLFSHLSPGLWGGARRLTNARIWIFTSVGIQGGALRSREESGKYYLYTLTYASLIDMPWRRRCCYSGPYPRHPTPLSTTWFRYARCWNAKNGSTSQYLTYMLSHICLFHSSTHFLYGRGCTFLSLHCPLMVARYFVISSLTPFLAHVPQTLKAQGSCRLYDYPSRRLRMSVSLAAA